jgi:hypothetical protein
VRRDLSDPLTALQRRARHALEIAGLPFCQWHLVGNGQIGEPVSRLVGDLGKKMGGNRRRQNEEGKSGERSEQDGDIERV